MKVITLREPAVCSDCSKHLPAGTRARYYSRDRIYCEEHPDREPTVVSPRGARPAPGAAPRDQWTRDPLTHGAASAGAPITREELVHLLEGIKFIVDSVLDQLKEE